MFITLLAYVYTSKEYTENKYIRGKATYSHGEKMQIYSTFKTQIEFVWVKYCETNSFEKKYGSFIFSIEAGSLLILGFLPHTEDAIVRNKFDTTSNCEKNLFVEIESQFCNYCECYVEIK